MIAYPQDVAARIASLYEQEKGGDVTFEAVLTAFPGADFDEEALADIIDADGRARLERQLEVPLERYLEALPDLATLPIALDAAIEFALRGMVSGKEGRGQADRRQRGGRAVETLIRRFPSLETPIRTTSMLNEALFATWRVQGTDGERPGDDEPELPADYGPVLPDGRSRYELRSRIGRGAHGAVYLAVDRHLSDEGRPAYTAIKILSRGADHSRAASVREEAVRARRVNHPSVVRVLDRGADDDGRGYIVYEYVDGPSLREWLMQRPAPPAARLTAQLVAGIAHGVQAAHAAGVVHCDLKPDNIIMARPSRENAGPSDPAGDLSPKVTDFGLAVCLEGARAAAHRGAGAARVAGTAVWGSLGFVAPEQYRGEEGALAPPADVYALGGVLYYLLTGRFPNGQSPDEVRRNLKHLDGEERRDTRSLRFDGNTDPDLVAICQRALAMETKDRYASAEAVAADLEAWQRREPLRWMRPTLQRRIALFARRQPLAGALLILTFILATAAGAAGVRWHMASEHRLMQAKYDAAKKLEAETEEWHERYKVLTSAAFHSLSRSRSRTVVENWLSSVITLETFFGREAIADVSGSSVWSQRIETVQAIVNDARAGGNEPPIIPLLWESALGFWTLNDGDPAEARIIFDRNRESWARRTMSADPWLGCLELLQAAAVVQEHFGNQAAQPAGSPRPPSARDLMRNPASELAIAVQTLHREAEVFTGSMAGGTAHRAVLRTLHDLYGPAHLNEPQRRRQIESRFNALSR